MTEEAPKRKARDIVGTHMGHLSDEARYRRVEKNARNANRVHPTGKHGLDMPVRGSERKHRA